MLLYLLKALIAGVIIVAVSEFAQSQPRLGAVILCLPLTTLLAFVAAHVEGTDAQNLSLLARDSLILVPLTLGFYLPFVIQPNASISFWLRFSSGLVIAVATVSIYLWRTGGFQIETARA